VSSWSQASEAMRKAIRETVVPSLRAIGFKGSFPHFSRPTATRIDLLTFQFSQFGPDLYIEVASCPPEGVVGPGGSTIPPDKVRTHHVGLLRRRIGPQPSLDFGDITDAANGRPLAERVAAAIAGEGEPWWANPQSNLPPNTSLERARDR